MPGLAVRPGDLVVPDRDPRVLVGDTARMAGPRAARDRGLGRSAGRRPGGIVARRPVGAASRRSSRGRPVDSGRWPPDETNGRPASPPAHEVETVWDARIPARDGIELSANLWLPRAVGRTARTAFPAILEMIPYGKDNWRRQRGHRPRHLPGARAATPSAGSTCAGPARPAASRSTSTREAETLDGFDAVEWLAAQPWCNGAVGMWGISYGGVHLDPGREAPAAAPARDRADPGHRRPLPDRRPLHRRLRHRSAS